MTPIRKYIKGCIEDLRDKHEESAINRCPFDDCRFCIYLFPNIFNEEYDILWYDEDLKKTKLSSCPCDLFSKEMVSNRVKDEIT